MAYSSNTAVRTEAGFTGNTYITDETIDAKIAMADAEIDGILSISGYVLPFAETPPVISVISQLLAAGHLLAQDYGAVNEGTNKEGNAKKAEARSLLKDIRGNTIILLDSSGNPLSQGDGPSGSPNDEIVSATDDPRPPIFTMADRF